MITPIDWLLNIETIDGEFNYLFYSKFLQCYNFVHSFPYLILEECCRSKLLFADEMQQYIASQLLISTSLLSTIKTGLKRSITDILNRLSILKLILLDPKQTDPQPKSQSSALIFLFSSCEIMISDLYLKLHSEDPITTNFKHNCQSFWIGSTEISFFKLNAATWQNIQLPLSQGSAFYFTSKEINSNSFRSKPFISTLFQLLPGLFEQKINPGMYLQWSLLIGTMDLAISSLFLSNVPFLAAIFLLFSNYNSLISISENRIIFNRIDVPKYLFKKYLLEATTSDYEAWNSAFVYWSQQQY